MRGWRRLFYLVVVGLWMAAAITGFLRIAWLLYTDLSVWAAIFFVSFIGALLYEVSTDE